MLVQAPWRGINFLELRGLFSLVFKPKLLIFCLLMFMCSSYTRAQPVVRVRISKFFCFKKNWRWKKTKQALTFFRFFFLLFLIQTQPIRKTSHPYTNESLPWYNVSSLKKKTKPSKSLENEVFFFPLSNLEKTVSSKCKVFFLIFPGSSPLP